MILNTKMEDMQDEQQKLSWAYSMLKPDIIKKAFPNGKAQAEIILRSIANILGFNTEYLNAQDYYNILNIYSKILIMFNNPNITDTNIKKLIQKKYRQYITSEDINKIFAYVYINIPNTTFAAINSHNINIISAISEHINKTDKMNLQNSQNINSDYLAHPQYGLVPDRPIYLCGTRDLNFFLNHLETEKKQPLKFKRVGSEMIAGIQGNIDIFKSYLSNGEIYGIIYINTHSAYRYNISPFGYLLNNAYFTQKTLFSKNNNNEALY